jgi:monoamine oxidase
MPERVIIVGAGLAGLVTAQQLARHGIGIVVLEAGDRAGGRVSTVPFDDGATAEAGAEEFWDSSPAFALLHSLDLPLIEQAAHSSVLIDGRLSRHRSGSTTEDHLGVLFNRCEADAYREWSELASSIADAFGERPRCARSRFPGLLHTRFSSFLAASDLPDRVRAWIKVLVETEAAVEWDRIAAADGVAEMLPFFVGPGDPAESPRCVRVAGGNARFVTALMAHLPEGTVRLGTRVRRIDDRPGGVFVTCEDERGRRHVERGDHVVLTAPLWSLAAVDFVDPLDPSSRAALATAAAGSYVKVVLRLRRDRVGFADDDVPFPLLTDGRAGCLLVPGSPPQSLRRPGRRLAGSARPCPDRR